MAQVNRRSIAAVAVALGTVLMSVAIAVFFVRPATTAAHRSDAIIVLSGDNGERISRALQLMNEKLSPTLVFDGQRDTAISQRLCQEHQSFEVVCLRPSPDNTRDEARAAAHLAVARNWRTVVVVTSMQHITRARLLFGRCFNGDLQMVGARPPLGLVHRTRAIAHEVFGSAWALMHPGC